MRTLSIAALALALAACRTTGGTGSSQVTGASAPRPAVEQFLASAKSGDLQAMATIWGTSKGAARDHMDRAELEKRTMIMACYFNHDNFRILQEKPGDAADRREFVVEMTKGGLTRASAFFTVLGPAERWYVESADINAVKDFCRGGPNPSQR